MPVRAAGNKLRALVSPPGRGIKRTAPLAIGALGMGKEKGKWPPENVTGEYATVAGGCFWGIELAFQRVHGVKATCVGYCGGHKKDPSYEEVCMTDTGHTEAVQMVYDPEEVSYDHLLGVFQQHHDPTQVNRQGNDVGSQYRSAIFYHNDEQRERAEEWKSQIPECATEIAPEGNNFWPAEEYHQRYLERGGRFGVPQSAEKGCTDAIRCYG